MNKALSIVISILMLSLIVFTDTRQTYASVQTPISRSQVEQRALDMVNYQWSFTSGKNNVIDAAYTSAVTLPNQFNGITTGNMTGIPYAWGGFDSLETSSYNVPWSNFPDAVNQGAFTGNINAHAGLGYVKGTAGLDCSGFIQAAFNIKDYKQSTTTLLNNYFIRIDISELKHMDILDYPGVHALIFDSWGTLNGVEGAFTYESTPDQTYGGIQGTKKYFISKSALNNGYIPARYKYIIEGDATAPAPITTPAPVPTPAPAPAPAPSLPHPVDTGIFARITNSVYWVNMHSNPSSNSNIVNQAPGNEIVYISSYSLGWYKVVYNGSTGWVWGQYITSIPSGKYVTIKNAYQLNIRNNPWSTAKVIGVLKQNQYAQVIGYSSDGAWMKINIGNLQGWSSTRYLSYIY